MKKIWNAAFEIADFAAHFYKMSDEEIIRDIKEGIDLSISRKMPESDSCFLAKCMLEAENKMKKISDINRENVNSRWKNGDSQRGDGGGHEAVIPAAPADAEPKTHKVTADEETFITFREAFPGTRRTWTTEFARLKKHRDWKAAIPLLMPALDKEKAWRQRCADIGAFCPEWAMLSTWINQRRWEQELAEPSAPVAQKTARQLENEKNERETAEWIQSLGKEKNAEPKGFLDDLSRDILGGMKNGQ